MNYSKAILMIIMMLSFALAGCTSGGEKETRYEIQGYMIVHDYDSPQKIGFNKQDALLNMEFESNVATSLEWANLTITVEVVNSDGTQFNNPLNETCLPPTLVEVENTGSGSPNVRINEIVASNDAGLQDENGDYDDWLELYNPGAEPMDLSNWKMTDAFEEYVAGGKEGYTFPAGTSIPAGGYLIVWGDDEPEEGPLHMNFKLKSEGEMVSLINPQGDVHQNISWPALSSTESYAAVPDGSVNFQQDQTPTASRTNGMMSGQDINPEAGPGSMGTGCMIIQEVEDTVWTFGESILLMEDGIDICGTGDEFPICYVKIHIEHTEYTVLMNNEVRGLT